MKKIKIFLLVSNIFFIVYFFIWSQRFFECNSGIQETCFCTTNILAFLGLDCLCKSLPILTAAQKQSMISMLTKDFVFILFYFVLLVLWSYLEMQRQSRLWLNNLLRLNIFLCLLVAVADVIENLLLLYMLNQSYSSGKPFEYNTIFNIALTFSGFKWIGAVWVLVMIFTSRLLRSFGDSYKLSSSKISKY